MTKQPAIRYMSASDRLAAQRKRREKAARRESRLEWLGLAGFALVALLGLAFWASVIFAALHFILKMW